MVTIRTKHHSAVYAAFLRGINVGGISTLKMADLVKAFEGMGFRNVRTVLASGNVIFEAPGESTVALSELITRKLREAFGRDILVIVRSIEDLRELEAQQPFSDVVVTPQTRLIVMFLSEDTIQPVMSDMPAHEDFRIVCVHNRSICGVIDEEQGTATVQLMGALEKEFGKQVTTRTWNTVLRVIKASEKTGRKN
jgi:uncharacterized protein (DUF1697 family)